MDVDRRKLGRWGEEVAAQFLRRKGYHIVTKNFLRRIGEIDVIAHKDGVMVFCEVKTKVATDYLPHEQVNWRKQRKLMRTAELFLKEHRLWERVDFRIDVIEVYVVGRSARINHYENAIERPGEAY